MSDPRSPEEYAKGENAEKEIHDLRKALRRNQEKLDQATAKVEDLRAAVYQAMHDAVASLDIPLVPNPASDVRDGGEEIALACLSDLHVGKRTTSYDSQVAAQRVVRFADKVIHLTKIQRADHPVRHCVLLCLGDFVEGEILFPSQAYLIDSGLFTQVSNAAEILTMAIRTLLTEFETVRVIAVNGNHGHVDASRRKSKMKPTTNADHATYSLAKRLLLKEPRVSWEIADPYAEHREWFRHIVIGRYTAIAMHGDQFRGGGFAGFPFYGVHKRTGPWRAGVIGVPFRDVYCGHFHQSLTHTLNGSTLRVVGSTESDNDFAREELASRSDPSQLLVFVHPELGMVTAEYTIYLQEEQKKRGTSRSGRNR